MSVTADSYDSYRQTLRVVMGALDPVKVLEFGTGKSTLYMAAHPSVQSLVSMEHDKVYYDDIISKNPPNTKIIFQPDIDSYATRWPKDSYDFVFIDGRNRVRCMRETVKCAKVSMLHDAERERYSDGLKLYKNIIFTDNGSTATMTNDDEVFNNLCTALAEESLICA